MRIWFVRHGETLFNRLRRFQGQCDAPLTEKGIHDAERARDALKDMVFTKAFCSYSGRAEDTARIIRPEQRRKDQRNLVKEEDELCEDAWNNS